MAIKKYINLENLSVFLDGLKDKFAALTHTHDDLYYTETEVDALLEDKADVDHNHDSAYDVKGSADTALASAKTYADNAATNVKNDLLNGAGEAYDTLKELGDLISENVDAIEALETIATGKADSDHNHNDDYYTKTEINTKVDDINSALNNKVSNGSEMYGIYHVGTEQYAAPFIYSHDGTDINFRYCTDSTGSEYAYSSIRTIVSNIANISNSGSVDTATSYQFGTSTSNNILIGNHSTTSRAMTRASNRIDFLIGTDTTSSQDCITIGKTEANKGLVIRPTTNQTGYLGNENYKWYSFNVVQGNSDTAITTSSDRRIKNTIEDLDDKYVELWDLLQPKSYYLNNYNTDTKQVGFIAQDVEDAMLSVGLELSDCGFLRKTWIETEEYTGYSYSLDYNGLAVLTHAKAKKMQKELDETKSKLTNAEERIAKLEELVSSLIK